MKRIILLILVSFVLISCEKETPEPTKSKLDCDCCNQPTEQNNVTYL